MYKSRLKIAVYILLFIFSFSIFFSCSKDDGQTVIINQVLLVYLAGDNSLSGESYEKLEAVRSGWNRDQHTKILIYHDPSDAPPKLMEVIENNRIRLIEEYPEENSAAPLVFHRIVTDAKTVYPQAVFNLLAFSHASGWLPHGRLSSPKSRQDTKSVLADGSSGMELTDFASAIPDNAFDYIIFESCFMAGIEVSYQLRNKAHYVVSSSAEIVSPGFTSVYPSHVNELLSGDPLLFAQAAFGYFDSQSGWMRSATFSVIRTDQLDALAAYIKANCDYTKPITMTDIQYFDRNNYHLFADFEDYYSRLLEKDDQRQEIGALIDHCIVWKAATPYFMAGYNGFTISRHSGMTTFIMQEEYPLLNTRYTELDWYKDSRTK